MEEGSLTSQSTDILNIALSHWINPHYTAPDKHNYNSSGSSLSASDLMAWSTHNPNNLHKSSHELTIKYSWAKRYIWKHSELLPPSGNHCISMEEGPGLRKGKIQLVPTVGSISRVIPTEIWPSINVSSPSRIYQGEWGWKCCFSLKWIHLWWRSWLDRKDCCTYLSVAG